MNDLIENQKVERYSYNPDVLTCLANLSSDEVFTPPKIANDVLDLLPESVWKNKDLKFLDPASKTGIFLREITKRLMDGLRDEIPNAELRLAHILKNQVYGIAITDLTSMLSRRTLYCSKNANSEFSIFNKFEDNMGNIFFKQMKHSWKNNFCEDCGAGRVVYDREDAAESYAYNYIHSDQIFKDLKFDVIVGGPPFQLYDGGGTGSSARPIYQKFIEKAISQQPKYLCMVIPARWYSGGKGLDGFRDTMLNDRRIRKLVDFPDTRDVFPTDIAGGICYFLWERSNPGKCDIRTYRNGEFNKSNRFLNEFDTFIRDSNSVVIINKIRQKVPETLESLVSSRKPFGLDSNFKSNGKGKLMLRTSKGKVKVAQSEITAGFALIDRWKVLLSKASNDHGGQADKNGLRKIFSRIELLGPQEVCTESYLTVGSYSSEVLAKNMSIFLKSKFCRYLVSIMLLTHNISKGSFKYVPSLPMDEIWDDEKLNNFFSLTDDEVSFINENIRAMD
jgi:site-specific DNA-methyltransferase (adenine-specific)